jgi:membrane-associated phospholipid phosphatase
VVTPATNILARVARMATEIAQPPLVLSLLLILTSLQSADWPRSLLAGGIAALTICLVPLLAVVVLAKRGALTDHHVGDRKQRRPVMLWTLGSALVGCGILAIIGAPRPIWALIAGILCGIVALIVISPIWKMSGHALTLGGTATSALLIFGWVGLPFVIAAPLVCWSRVYLRDHTASQVIIGFVTGVAAFGTSYSLVMT